jgi:hypothetical protein
VDVALEVWVSDQYLRLPDERIPAPPLNYPSLVKGEGAEVALPEAAPARGEAERDLLDSLYPAQFRIHGMEGSCVGKFVDLVQFLPVQGFCRGILKNPLVPGAFEEGFRREGVRVAVLDGKTLGKGTGIP